MAGMRAIDAAMLEMDGPFIWGERDCCTAACAAFARLWGDNPMAAYPKYSGLRGAAEFLKQFGGRDECANVITAQVGLVPCEYTTGALCAAWVTPRRWALGVCLSDGLVAFKGAKGLSMKQPENARYWIPPCPQ